MRHALVVATLISGGASAACGTATSPSVQQAPSPAVSSIAPSPAPASTEPGASASSAVVTVQGTCPGHCVDITFELTVVAAPPAGESLSLDVRIPGQPQHVVTLCGAAGARQCAGDGTVYRLVFSKVAAGASATYSFEEVSTSADHSTQVTAFRQGTVDLATSSTVTANFPTGP